jgi:Zn finger protein HypA/HybF involved in hydrogenase expression
MNLFVIYKKNFFIECLNCNFIFISTGIIKCPRCNSGNLRVRPINYNIKELEEIKL